MDVQDDAIKLKTKQDDLILQKLRKKLMVEIIRRRAATPHQKYELTEMEECELICMYILGKVQVDINKIVAYVKRNYYT